MRRRQIVVLDRFRAETFECELPWACISIADREGEWPEIPDENRVGLLQVAFADITRPLPGFVRFGSEEAHDILDFVGQTWPRIRVLLIHCNAGISRSSAVAAAVCRIRRQPAGRFLREPYVPNGWVYSTLMEVASGRADCTGADEL